MRKLSVIRQIIKLVFANVAADKMRTFLTCLGIIIGTAAMICMTTSFKIQKYGDDKDDKANGYYYSNIDLYRGSFKDSDLEKIRAIDNVAGLSPEISADSQINIKLDNVLVKNVDVIGVDNDYFDPGMSVNFDYGNGFNNEQEVNCEQVCVINRNVARKLFGNTNPVGLKLRLFGTEFEIVGVSNKYKDSSKAKTIYIPYTTLRKISGNEILKIWVYPVDNSVAYEVDEAVKDYVRSIVVFEDDYIDSFDYEWLTDYEKEVFFNSVVQIVVAVLALTIGGIGIMNMMHVMVTERTVEIGLRKALGATPARIQIQFILESMIISVLGGAVGAVAGLIGSFILCHMSEVQFMFSPVSVLISLLFSVSVGVFFGWAPAKKASRLNAIDALKSE